MTFGTAIVVRKVLAPGLLLILPALVLIAACGGGDDEGGTGSNATATRAEETDGAEPTGEDGGSSPTEDNSGGNGGGDINACALLTDEEVEAVLGTPATGSPEADLGVIKGCRWEPGGLLLVTVSVFRGTKEEVAAYFEFSQEISDSVEGIGQKAHYSDVTKSLEVLVDDETDVTVAVVNADIDEKQAAIDLAEKVLDRLP